MTKTHSGQLLTQGLSKRVVLGQAGANCALILFDLLALQFAVWVLILLS